MDINHAHELRRHARKIGRPSGDTPAVMHAAAAHIEDLERRLREAEKDSARHKWAMNQSVSCNRIEYAQHVLSRGGAGDLSDIRTFIDAKSFSARRL